MFSKILTQLIQERNQFKHSFIIKSLKGPMPSLKKFKIIPGDKE